MAEETVTGGSGRQAPKAGLTRRTFLKLTAWGTGALAIAAVGGRAIVDGLVRLGIATPWYRQGQITTTDGYCDMCPWRCGIVVKSVDGTVHKIDGNPADPKSRGMLCARGQAGVSFLYDPDRLKTPQAWSAAELPVESA